MKKNIQLIIILSLIMLLLSSCSQPEPVEVEVTRLVEVEKPVEVEVEVTRLVEVEKPVEVEVEVTRLVEVEKPVEVEVEVTRLVEVNNVEESTETTASSSNADPTDASLKFSANHLGELEQNDIKVEFYRVIVMHRDAIEDLSFDDAKQYDGHEYVAEIMWRITNNTDKSIEWWREDINARINGKQIDLYDWTYDSFGESPTDEIYPGSTITGGLWFGIGDTLPDDVTSFDLLMGKPYESGEYDDMAGNFIIAGDLSGDHTWEPLPDDHDN